MTRSNDPFWWALFSAGGVVAALFVPVMIILTGLAGALDWFSAKEAMSYDRLHALLVHPIARILLFGIISLPLFHWAHRFRFTLVDLGLRPIKGLVGFLCYGGAITGSVLAGIVLWNFN